MAKRLRPPNDPPSRSARAIIANITKLAAQANPDVPKTDRYQQVVDLVHLENAVRDLLDPAIHLAITRDRGRDGGLTTRALAGRINLAAGATGDRAANGAAILAEQTEGDST